MRGAAAAPGAEMEPQGGCPPHPRPGQRSGRRRMGGGAASLDGKEAPAASGRQTLLAATAGDLLEICPLGAGEGHPWGSAPSEAAHCGIV